MNKTLTQIIKETLKKSYQELVVLPKLALIYIKGRLKTKSISERKNLKLDLGSSSSLRNGFVGIDLTEGSDLVWDLTWGIPFYSNSVAEIRSDHFFEHLGIDDLLFVLKDCHRVLKKGGELNFAIPHIDPYINAYVKNDLKFLKRKITDVPLKYQKIYNNPFDLVMWLIYRNGDHKVFFDSKSIVSKLEDAGFKEILFRDYNKKEDINKRFSSIYVVAKK